MFRDRSTKVYKLTTSQLVFSMQLLFIFVVFSSKVAASLLIHRLTCHKIQRIYTLATVTASVVCCLISLLVLSVGFASNSPWEHQQDGAATSVCICSSKNVV